MYESLMVVAVLIALPRGPSTMDRESLVAVLDSLHAPVRDLSLEYEGTVEWLAPLEGNTDEASEEFSGKFVYLSHGGYFADIFHKRSSDSRLFRETYAVVDGRMEEYSREFDRRGAHGVITKAYGSKLNNYGGIGRIFFWEQLRDDLTSPTVDMQYDGTEDVDGSQCIVIRVGPARGTYRLKGETPRYQKYWIDLERGGNPIQYGSYREDHRPEILIKNVKLMQFKTGKEDVWLPVSGQREVYPRSSDEGISIFAEKPQERDVVAIVRASVRINSGVKKTDLSIKYDYGTTIDDRLRFMKSEYGQRPEPLNETVAQRQDRLDAVLRDASTQANQLRATSKSRTSSVVTYWVPWSVAVISLAALAWAIVLRRRAK